MEARKFLGEIRLFAEVLDAGQLDFLAAQSHPAFFRQGTLLMSQGDFGVSMFAIVDGTVSVNFADPQGGAQIVTTLGAGEIVGEMSLFTGDRRTATVAAVTNVNALEISKASLERVFARSPSLLERFGAVLAARQAELDDLARTRSAAGKDEFIRQARKFFSGLFGKARRIGT